MNRRSLLRYFVQAAAAGASSTFGLPLLGQTTYEGKLLVHLQLDGGVDVSSFCDPKLNISGERRINNWADSSGIEVAGNIPYANYASNATFFERFYQHMLVINGVDAQTNAHSTGILHNWSGRTNEGFPTLTALMAAIQGPKLPLAYLNFGGLAATSGIIRYSRIQNVDRIRVLTVPNASRFHSTKTYVPSDTYNQIKQMLISDAEALVLESTTTAGNASRRESYFTSAELYESLDEFGSLLPDDADIYPAESVTSDIESNLKQQIQVTLTAMRAGVTIAADLYARGFDTHVDHDSDHPRLLANATEAIEFFWDMAEETGLADRLILVIGSDFSRTPFYNASEGKDHWSIGSYIIMEKNAPYTNRVIGETDGVQNAFRINPETTIRDDIAGITLHPAHIHKALRKHLGLDSNPIAKAFPFSTTEEVSFFG